MSSATGTPTPFYGHPHGSVDVVPEVSATLDALDEFAQFVDELYDTPKPRKVLWEGNPSRVAIRSVGRVVCEFRHAVKPSRPPIGLIVRLARKLPSVLTEICAHPKHILQRRRSIEPLSRIRELDSSCVRWLTRQPGNTIVEKSGHRRSILAVQRFESVDTLENRVVVDLLRRCTALASDYLRQHQAQFPKHPWVCMTADFLSLCRRLQTFPQLQEIGGLPSLPKPNYVLLHESRYKQVWQAYTEVIRQQRRRQQLWMWRHSAFADMLAVSLMCSASHFATRQSRRFAHRFELHLRQSPLQGEFFDWKSPPPLWQLSPEQSLFVGPLECARQLLGDAQLREVDDCSLRVCAAVQQNSSWNVFGLTAVFPDDPTDQNLVNAASEDRVTLNVLDLSTSGEAGSTVFSAPLDMTRHPRCLDQIINKWRRE